MTYPRFLFPAAFACALLGCADLPAPQPPADLRPQLSDEAGRCYGRDVTPARTRTVTQQTMVQPAAPQDAPGVYRTVTQQRIVAERREIEFRTPCAEKFTPEFIASLQRALTARGYYRGTVDGVLDVQTGRAIRAYQRRFGPDSAILSLEAAQRLGLVELSPGQIEAANRASAADPFIVPLR